MIEPSRFIREHNLYTGLSFWQTSRFGWSLAPTEAYVPIPYPADALPGMDMRTIITAELVPLFPRFEHWDLDIDGNPVNWSKPFVGCRA